MNAELLQATATETGLMVAEILRSAEAQGVRVYLRAGKLLFTAPRGALDSVLRSQLQLHKARIIEHLREVPSPVPTLYSTAPASCAQERIWLLDRLEGNSAAYNMPAAYRLHGTLDIAALRASFRSLIERHSALRTNILADGATLTQRVRSDFSVPLTEVDLAHLTAARVDEELARLMEREALRHFDLMTEMPLRVTVARLSERDHLLLVTAHHIACDGWSIGPLLEELGALYDAHARGRGPSLPALRFQYTDYARWQRRWLQGTEARNQLEYWKRALENLPPSHSLHLDASRARSGPGLGALYDRHVELGLLRTVEKSVAEAETTLFMFLHAVFALLLARYGDETDVVVGVPVAGRVHHDVETLVGNLVNTLVLRLDLADNPTFVELLRRTRVRTLEALHNQQYPFEKLVEHIVRERALHVNPIFQVMFALHDLETEKLALGDVNVTRLEQAATTAKLDLELHVLRQHDGGLCFRWVYDSNLFSAQTIASLADAYFVLLEQAVETPRTRVQDFSLCSPARRLELLAAANGAKRTLPPLATHQLFEDQVQKTPAAIAVELGADRLTYQELDRRANQLAHRLVAAGVGPGTLVGICARRSLSLVSGLLAIWKAGGAYVPLDPDQPPARTEEIRRDAKLALVLIQEELRGQFDGLDVHLLQIDETDGTRDATTPACRANLEAPAYVLYTSGSTGRPKGAVIRHRSLVNYLAHAVHDYMRPQIAGAVVSSPLAFDATITSLLTPLLVGARVRLLPDGDTERLLSQLTAELFDGGASWLFKITPAHLEVLAAQTNEPNATSYHIVVVGGEQLTAHTLSPWRTRLLPRSTFVNEYGPTETVVGCSVYTIEPGQADSTSADGAIPIGRPIQNTQLYVLNSKASALGESALQPAEATGELYIGGVGLAREYLDREELTRERFVPDPFSRIPGERLYRTGDRVRRRADGELEFLGRADHQVKLRGYRIELGEIEASLASHSSVHTSVVVAREDVPTEKRLVAYVVARDGAEVDASTLREHLKARLPEYMVPSSFVFLNTLPVTPNGKVDRKALPLPEPRMDSAEYVAPAPGVEQQLAHVWADVLRLPRVGATDNFFELGGHSLLATQLVSRICKVLGMQVPLRALFEAPTVQTLARKLERNPRALEDGDAPTLARIARDSPLPLSFAQQRLWFLDQLEPNSSAYNMPAALRLRGELDAEALRRALQELVRRHESLRTRFVTSERGADQVIDPPSHWQLPTCDLTSMAETEREAEIHRLAEVEAAVPFSLVNGPLFRTALLKLGAMEHVLLATMHHIVSDGWSLGVMIREISSLYAAFRARRPSPLSEPAIQYADFAVWQRAFLQGERLAAQVRYWKQTLSDVPPLALPMDRPCPSIQSTRGGAVPVRLRPELTAALHELSRKHGATLFMTLLTAFEVFLRRYSGQDDFAVGTFIANRTRAELDPLVGFFVNTLAIRATFTDNPTFSESIATVRAATLGAYAHQDIPFERIIEELGLPRRLGRSPVFQAMFALQNAPIGELSLPGLTLCPIGTKLTTSQFDLTLSLGEVDGQISGNFAYCSDLFDRDTVVRMANNFAILVEDAVSAPHARISDLRVLAPSEEHALLTDWNHAPAGEAQEACIHQLFEAQARRTPDAAALEYGTARTSYGELDARANRLAGQLRKLGVRHEDRVAVCVQRSIEMVVSLLAVLKAGAAYVPLDPTLPTERHGFILEDSEARVVVTDAASFDRFAAQPVQTVRADWESADGVDRPEPRPEVSANQLAYVIYTSGSTGKPKGVAVEHRSVCNLILAEIQAYGIDAETRMLQFASFAFDISVEEIFVTLCAGGTVVLAPGEEVLPGEELEAFVRARSITAISMTPSSLAALPAGNLPLLRTVISGGETCSAELVARFAPGRQFFNTYGPTECTVIATLAECRPDDRAPSIGRPFASARIYVLDRRMQPVPVGVVGELYIGGPGVARGYLNRPALTAERFVPNTFGKERGDRLFRTGDLVRFRNDGQLEFAGRTDLQVKIRGFRIELGEVESALSANVAVKACAVVARDDPPGEKRLVAYVVARDGAELAAATLRQDLEAQLPAYMVPSAFVFMDSLPLTPNGKVDRKTLPAPDGGSLRAAYVTPREGLEQQLSELWGEVLHLPRVGATDNFFELGGHSLLAAKLVARIRAELSVPLRLASLFQNPTVERLAAVLDDECTSPSVREDPLAICLQPGRDGGRPLFLVHGAGGNALIFSELSASLSPMQPVYGLQSPGFDGGAPFKGSIEALAALYVTRVRQIQAVGPYQLGGWSFGGVVAFEMARQLTAMGHTVNDVALLDAHPRGLESNVDDLEPSAAFARTLGIPHGTIAVHIPHTLGQEDRLAYVLDRASSDVAHLPDRAELGRLLSVLEGHVEAFKRYIPESWQAPLVLFKSKSQPSGTTHDLGWGALTSGRLTIVEVPGDHFSMMRGAHAASLARALSAHLLPATIPRA